MKPDRKIKQLAFLSFLCIALYAHPACATGAGLGTLGAIVMSIAAMMAVPTLAVVFFRSPGSRAARFGRMLIWLAALAVLAYPLLSFAVAFAEKLQNVLGVHGGIATLIGLCLGAGLPAFLAWQVYSVTPVGDGSRPKEKEGAKPGASRKIKQLALLSFLCIALYARPAYATGEGIGALGIGLLLVGIVMAVPTLVVVFFRSPGDRDARLARTWTWLCGMALAIPLLYCILTFAGALGKLLGFNEGIANILGFLTAALLPAFLAWHIYIEQHAMTASHDELLLSAKEGDPEAQAELALSYYWRREYAEAYFWHALSARVFRKEGSASAAAAQEERRDRLRARLRPYTVAEQDTRVSAWMADKSRARGALQ